MRPCALVYVCVGGCVRACVCARVRVSVYLCVCPALTGITVTWYHFEIVQILRRQAELKLAKEKDTNYFLFNCLENKVNQ